MPSSPLLSLPTELLKQIVLEVQAQDDAFEWQKLAAAADRSTNHYSMLNELMTITSWYGRSLWSLYAVCKDFRNLCEPYVFEYLHVHRSDTEVFRSHIAPRYAHHFSKLIMDSVTDNTTSLQDAMRALLLQLSGFRKVTRVAYRSETAAQVFSELLGHNANAATPEAKVRRMGFNALQQRVTTVAFKSVSSQLVQSNLAFFVNATGVAISDSAIDADRWDYGPTLANMPQLK